MKEKQAEIKADRGFIVDKTKKALFFNSKTVSLMKSFMD
jgi:hypothetical protein